MGLSADELMVDIVALEKYRDPDYYFEAWEVPDGVDPVSRARNLIHLFNKKPYAWLSLPWFVWKWWKRRKDPKWTGENWIKSGAHCSEVSLVALIKNGNATDLKCDSTDPQEVYDFVKTIPGAKQVEIWTGANWRKP